MRFMRFYQFDIDIALLLYLIVLKVWLIYCLPIIKGVFSVLYKWSIKVIKLHPFQERTTKERLLLKVSIVKEREEHSIGSHLAAQSIQNKNFFLFKSFKGLILYLVFQCQRGDIWSEWVRNGIRGSTKRWSNTFSSVADWNVWHSHPVSQLFKMNEKSIERKSWWSAPPTNHCQIIAKHQAAVDA